MNWLIPKLFKRTLLEDTASKLVVQGYRSHARANGGPPTHKTTDRQIVEIYEKVGSAFRTASKQRGEHLSAPNLNFIVLKFLTVHEMLGRDMVESHLQYEVDKYIKEGLREDYRRELHLFDEPNEPPLWHQQIPEPLQYSNPQLIANLEEVRKEFGFDHQTFNGALMTSKNMIWRSVRWAYQQTRRELPGLSDYEYFAIVLIKWITNKILLLPGNTSPTAWNADQLKKIIDEAEKLVRECNKIGDVCYLIVEIEAYEGTFSDPLGLILRIDSVCSAATAAK
jgi:hypothetical protein